MGKRSKIKGLPVQLSPSRKKLFFILTLAFPLIFFVLLESALRIFRYGHDLSIFTHEKLGPRTLTVMNPGVEYRYFTRIDFSPNTSHDYFEMPKPPGTYRIFCLGGSTTVGFPYGLAGSFSTFLRQRLQAIFPDKKIDVINLGMTATNSYATLDIVRGLFEMQPDLAVIYDGHNEFYGAPGIASHETLGGDRSLTNIYLRLSRLKTFLLIRNFIEHVREIVSGPASPVPGGIMMEQLAKNEYIPYGSEEYRRCLHNFRENMNDIVSLAAYHHLPVIVSSQVSNLRDLPPFISGNSAALSKEQLREYNEGLGTAERVFHAGKYDSTIVLVRRLIGIDPLRADVHFLYALCLDSLSRKPDALREYRYSRDYDELRFRMSSDFNNILPGLTAMRGIYFTDIERVFEGHSPDSLVGKNLILEHLHPNLRGYFLMAKAYARTMRENQMLGSEDQWKARDTVSDSTLWTAGALSPVDEYAAEKRMNMLTSGWPFKKSERIPYIPREWHFEEIIDRLVYGKTTWEEAHVAAAEYFNASRRTAECEKEYRTITDQLPYNVSAYLFLGQMYLREKDEARASGIFERSLRVEKTSYALRSLGMMALERNDLSSAMTRFQESREVSTEDNDIVASLYLLALAHSRQHDNGAALVLIDSALALKPSYLPVLELREKLTKVN